MNKNKVNIDAIDLEKDKDKITDLPGLIQYAHNVGSAIIKPEDTGRIKGTAITAMREQTGRQYKQLYDQMEMLVKQAESLKQRVEISERIYQAKINFKPVYQQEYFLYQREDGTDCLSMVGPTQWGKSFPFNKYLATVKLLADHTWEVIENNEDQNQRSVDTD